MNLIYLHTHDSGRWFQPYGYAVQTPHLMDLAHESLLFRNAYCCGPTCSPSRSGLLTGMAPHTNGMLGLAHRGFALYNPQTHLAAYLKSHGFETVLSGIQHEAEVGKEETLGYERVISPGMNMDQLYFDTVEYDLNNADRVVNYLHEKHDKPFFLSFGMFNTHRAYPDHRRGNIDPNYVLPPWPVADTPENREDMADYLYSVKTADECVGRVLDGLEKAGLADDTIVLMTTDHGLALPMMKCTLYDTGIGVAMMLRYPGNPAAGKVTDALVSQVDVFPTLCDLLQLPKPEWLQGVSLLPVIEKDETVREEIFSEITYHAAYDPQRCIRTGDWKLIVRFDDYRGVVAPNIDACSAKDVIAEAGFYRRMQPREELYNLKTDPVERQNLVNDPACAAVYHDLLSRLTRWMEQTDDPLLKVRYRVPKPEGAEVNLRENIDPQDGIYEA